MLKGCESESKIGFLFISWGEFFFMTSFNKKCRKFTMNQIRTFAVLVKMHGDWMNHAFKPKKRFLKICQPILERFNQLPFHFKIREFLFHFRFGIIRHPATTIDKNSDGFNEWICFSGIKPMFRSGRHRN